MKKLWTDFQRRRKLRRDLEADSFKRLGHELAEVTQAVKRLLPSEHSYQARLHEIEQDMADLDRLTSNPDFNRLSVKQKLQLRKNLIKSMDQLIEAAHTTSSPTDYLQ